jgi:hypothetical protein
LTGHHALFILHAPAVTVAAGQIPRTGAVGK